MSFEIHKCDITTLLVDAIVNAANVTLLGGGGVDGAIHRAAGPNLVNYCSKLPKNKKGYRCGVGEAMITPGFDLPAKHIIHTVGPTYHGKEEEAEQLANCYKNCISLALANNAHTIAFPAISAGIYGYPKDQATKIAVHAIKNSIGRKDMHVILTYLDADMLDHWMNAIEGL